MPKSQQIISAHLNALSQQPAQAKPIQRKSKQPSHQQPLKPPKLPRLQQIKTPRPTHPQPSLTKPTAKPTLLRRKPRSQAILKPAKPAAQRPQIQQLPPQAPRPLLPP